MNRTDLAYESVVEKNITEGITCKKKTIYNIEIHDIKISKEGEKAAEKPAGSYITVFSSDIDEEKVITVLATELSQLIPPGKILVVGLGNQNITPDSLGPRAVSGVVPTAHLKVTPEFHELNLREVNVVEVGVMAQTGMESADRVRYLVQGLKPEAVVAIDSLACSEPSRLGTTIQIADTGIQLGSGVQNKRKEISKATLGIPVFAVGVPTVVDLRSLVKDKSLDMMVTPRNIDMVIRRNAKILAGGINHALNPTLTPSDIRQLLM
jgi:spore protease